ncbi:MAG TPA: hypothetical protein VMS08_05385 [Candidatus Saccharimonadia bacterium]|nr:hypothetical protein [Candidatus Saccharimonadia bacterium]
MAYVFFFLAALFGANGVPHFVKGITGERHMSPFGKPSSAMVNVVWGAANFYMAFWLFDWALCRKYEVLSASLVVLVGVLACGVALAGVWQNDDKARGR